MSNIILTQVAFAYAENKLKAFLEEYNNSELTLLGKREVLRDSFAFSYIAGFNTAEENTEDLKQEIEFLRANGNKDCTAMADRALLNYRAAKKLCAGELRDLAHLRGIK